jgi:hypothetical protein
MRKPQIHQIQEQIENANRKLGKLSDEELFRQKKYVYKGNNNDIDGEIEWRKITFTSNQGPGSVPSVNLRQYVKNVVDELKNSTADFDDITDLQIQSSRITYPTSEIAINVNPREHIILYTTVNAPFNFSVPMEIFTRSLSCVIEVITSDSNGDPIIVRELSARNNIPERTSIGISAEKDTTVMIYVYNGSATSTKEFRINTNLYEVFDVFTAPAPFKPTSVVASLGESINQIAVSWDFDPFVTSSDLIEIWKGNVNDENEAINNTFIRVATISAFTIKFIDNVNEGTRAAYKIRYLSTNGGTSPFSDYAIGYAGTKNAGAEITLLPNELTGIPGYYSSRVNYSVRCLQPVRDIFSTATDIYGNVFTNNLLVPLDDTGKNFSGSFVIDSSWTEGTVTLETVISISRIIGEEGDGLGENTGSGAIRVSETFVVDYTPPTFGGIHISKEDDRDPSGDSYTNDLNVFVIPNYLGSYDLTAAQNAGVFGVPENANVPTSGIYQIQFAPNANAPDEYNNWTLWNEDSSYAINASPEIRTDVVGIPEATTLPIVIKARIRDRAGNVSDVEEDSIIWIRYKPLIDFTLAGTPDDLRIHLRWDRTQELQVRDYILYRSEGVFSLGTITDPRVSQFEIARINGINITGYTDSNVTPGNYYSYVMKVEDAFGNVSTGWSNIVQDITATQPTATGEGPNDNPLQVPQFISSKSYGHWDFINLEWIPNTEFNFVNYILYRGTDAIANGEDASAVATGVDPWFRDPRTAGVLETGNAYRYWVKAFNEYDVENAGPGTAYSNYVELSLRTDGPSPAEWVTGSSFPSFGFNHLELEDTSLPTDYVSEYKIYRAQLYSTNNVGVVTLVLTDDFYHIGSVKTSAGLTRLVFNDSSTVPGLNYMYTNAGVNQFDFEGPRSVGLQITGALPNYRELFQNYVDNGSFERGVASWSNALLNTRQSKFGQQCGYINIGVEAKQEYIFCQPNQSYYFSTYGIQNSVGATGYGYVSVDFYEPNNIYLSTSSFSFDVTDTNWVRTGFQFDTPFTASRMDLVLSGDKSGGPTSTLKWDGIQIEAYEAGVSPRPFIDSRTISADRLQAHFITGDMILASSITADVLVANTISGDKIAANTITANKLRIGFDNNLILNPTLSESTVSLNDTFYPGLLPNWTVYPHTAGDGQYVKKIFGIVNRDYWKFGNNGLYIESGYTVGAGIISSKAAIDNNQPYSFSFYTKAIDSSSGNTDGIYVSIYEYDSGHNSLGEFTSSSLEVISGGSDFKNLTINNGDSNWNRFSATIKPEYINVNTEYLELEIGISGEKGIYLDGIQLERGSDVSQFSHGLTRIEGGHIETDTIDAQHIQSDSIETRHLQAGSITADKLAVGLAEGSQFSGSNILFNPSLEIPDPIDGQAFNSIPGWNSGGSESSKIKITTDLTKIRDGESGALFENVNTLGQAYIETDIGSLVPVDPTEAYGLSFYTTVSLGTAPGYMKVKQYRFDNTLINDDVEITPLIGGSWNISTLRWEFDIGTSVQRFTSVVSGSKWHSDTRFIGLEWGAADSAKSIYLDALQFEWGEGASPYNRGVVLIESGMVRAGAIQAHHISAAVITGGHIQAGTIEVENIKIGRGVNFVKNGGFKLTEDRNQSVNSDAFPKYWSHTDGGYTPIWGLYDTLSDPPESRSNSNAFRMKDTKPLIEAGPGGFAHTSDEIPYSVDQSAVTISFWYYVDQTLDTPSNFGFRLNNSLDIEIGPTPIQQWNKFVYSYVETDNHNLTIRLRNGNPQYVYLTNFMAHRSTAPDGSTDQSYALPFEDKVFYGTTIDGDIIRTGAISSNNYSPSLQGWEIDTTGDVEFSDGLFRGNVVIGDGATIRGDAIIEGNLTVSGGLGPNLISNGSLLIAEAATVGGSFQNNYLLTENFFQWERIGVANDKDYVFYTDNTNYLQDGVCLNIRESGNGALITDKTYIQTNFPGWPIVETSKKYTISFYARKDPGEPTANPDIFCEIHWWSQDYGSTGKVSLTTTGSINMDTIIPGTEWARYWGIVEGLPSNVYFLETKLGANTAGGGFLLDAVQLEQGDTPSAFNSNNGVVVGGQIAARSISADEIKTDTITANEIATNTITANEIAAGTITADRLSFDVSGKGANLIVDGSFERWSNTPTGIDADDWTHNYPTDTIGPGKPVDSLFGSTCLVASGPLSSGPKIQTNEWLKIPFDENGNPQPLNLSFYIKRPDISEGQSVPVTVRLIVAGADGNGDPLELPSSYWPYIMSSKAWLTAGDNWTRVDSFITSGEGSGGSPYNDWNDVNRGYPITFGARFFKPAIWLGIGSPSDDVYLDGVQATIGQEAAPWRPREGTVIQGEYIKTGKIASTNFISGSQGWEIDLDGDAEFADVTIRGTATIEGDAIVNGSVLTEKFGSIPINLFANGGFDGFRGTEGSGSDASSWHTTSGLSVSHFTTSVIHDIAIYRYDHATAPDPIIGQYHIGYGGTPTGPYGISQNVYVDSGNGKQSVTISMWVRRTTSGTPDFSFVRADVNGASVDTTITYQPTISSNTWTRVAYSTQIDNIAGIAYLNIKMKNSSATSSSKVYFDGIMVEYTDAPDGSTDTKWASPFSPSVGSYVPGETIRTGKIESNDGTTYLDLDNSVLRFFADENDIMYMENDGQRRVYYTRELENLWSIYLIQGPWINPALTSTPYTFHFIDFMNSMPTAKIKGINGYIVGLQRDSLYSGGSPIPGTQGIREVHTIPFMSPWNIAQESVTNFDGGYGWLRLFSEVEAVYADGVQYETWPLPAGFIESGFASPIVTSHCYGKVKFPSDSSGAPRWDQLGIERGYPFYYAYVVVRIDVQTKADPFIQEGAGSI